MIDMPVKVYGRGPRIQDMLQRLAHADALGLSDLTIDMMYTILVND